MSSSSAICRAASENVTGPVGGAARNLRELKSRRNCTGRYAKEHLARLCADHWLRLKIHVVQQPGRIGRPDRRAPGSPAAVRFASPDALRRGNLISGSHAAASLAGAGHSVLVLERRARPGEKTACTGIVGQKETNPGKLEKIVINSFKLVWKRVNTGN